MERLRVKRVEKLVQEIVSAMILTGEIKDPRIDKLVSIYEVSLSNDFKFGKVYTTYYGEREIHQNCVTALNHAAGFIQKCLGKRLKTRNAPRLTFVIDDSIEKGFRITQKLKEIIVE